MYFPLLAARWSSSRRFAEAVLLETLLLSIYNHDSAIASAASRMTLAAGDRPCIEMGSRRTHEEAAVAARGRRTSPASRPPPTSRPGSGTACRRPAPARTASRCCTTPRRTRSAPRSSRSAPARPCWSTPTTSPRRCGSAVEVAGPGARRGAARLRRPRGAGAREVRAQLDALGATGTRIVVTSDLDEFAIAALAAAPVDGYGVGTAAGHRQRAPDLRLRLQAGRPRGRRGRAGVGGEEEHGQDLGRRPQVRAAPASTDGVAEAEVVGIGAPPADDGDDRPLLVAAGPGRRGRRARSRSTTPASGTLRARAELPLARPSRCRRASR